MHALYLPIIPNTILNMVVNYIYIFKNTSHPFKITSLLKNMIKFKFILFYTHFLHFVFVLAIHLPLTPLKQTKYFIFFFFFWLCTTIIL